MRYINKLGNSRIFLIVGVILCGLLIAGFAQFHKANNVYYIGITQPVSHPGIDIVRKGIIDELAAQGYKDGEKISIDFQNANGDSTVTEAIAQKFAKSDYDFFIPIGTSSSQSIAHLEKERPIIFATVTDPVSAGLVESQEKPGKNITGTSDMTMFKEQLMLLKKLVPDAKKVGVVYNPSESNSQFGMKETKKYAAMLGLEIVSASVSNSSEVYAAAQSLANKVDAFYIISDNTVIAGQDALIKVATESKKPLIATEESGVEKGALATLGLNYYDLGRLTAGIVIKVMNGEDPGKIAVVTAQDGDIFINTTTAKQIGVEIPKNILDSAKKIYE